MLLVAEPIGGEGCFEYDRVFCVSILLSDDCLREELFVGVSLIIHLLQIPRFFHRVCGLLAPFHRI